MSRAPRRGNINLPTQGRRFLCQYRGPNADQSRLRAYDKAALVMFAAARRGPTDIVGEGRLEVSAAWFEIRVDAAIVPVDVRVDIGASARRCSGVSGRRRVGSLGSALPTVDALHSSVQRAVVTGVGVQ